MPRHDHFGQLVRLMQKLRGPGGCPWDRKQTHTSLRPYLLEEAHEVLEAIAGRNPRHLQDELGDLLFQVIFHAQLAAEAGHFNIDDVLRGSLEKMIRRHPHIFGGKRVRSSQAVIEHWEEIKQRERGGSGASLLDGVPRSLPALLRAQRVQSKAARVGFHWSRIEEALAKVMEEIGELRQALESRRSARITEELGDAFFALVNLARFSGANSEDALHQAVGKFIQRFSRLERTAQRNARALSEFTPAEMLALWNQTKHVGIKPARGARSRRGKSPRRRKTPAESKNRARSEPSRRGRPR